MPAASTPAYSSRGLFLRRVGALLSVVGVSFSCGSRGLLVEEELLDGPGGRGGTGLGNGGGGGTGATSSDVPFRFEDTRLAECEPGFMWSASSDRPCNFRFNNRCYDDESDVCACACPREVNSRCILSGFLSDPNNPLTVSCQARR